MAPRRICTVCLSFVIWRSMCSALSYLVNTVCLSIFCLPRKSPHSLQPLVGGTVCDIWETKLEKLRNKSSQTCHKCAAGIAIENRFLISWECFCRQTHLKPVSPLSVFFLFGRHFVGLEHLCLARSSLIPCTLLFGLLKHRPHCCSHRGKASDELFCLYCKRQRERERAGKETRLRYWLFCLAETEARWCGKKRKTSCVLFMTEWQTLPQGITGLADRLSQAVLQPAFEILSVTEHKTLQP